MVLKSEPGEVSENTRYEALRRASDVIASQADLNGVLENLARFLPSVVKFEFLGVVLHDAEQQVFRLHAFESSVSPKSEVGIEIPVSFRWVMRLIRQRGRAGLFLKSAAFSGDR